MRPQDIFFSEAIFVSGGWVNWHVECVVFDDKGEIGYNETAGGATQTKLGARWHIRRAKCRFRRDTGEGQS